MVKGAAYCEVHRKVQRKVEDRDRATAAQRGYGSRWRTASKTFLARNPLCRHCAERGKAVPAEATDHVVPHRLFEALESGDADSIRQAQSLFWDTGNWQGLCTSCHAVKTNLEDGGFGRARAKASEMVKK